MYDHNYRERKREGQLRGSDASTLESLPIPTTIVWGYTYNQLKQGTKFILPVYIVVQYLLQLVYIASSIILYI